MGCLKLQVMFRKRAANCRALLRKMTYQDKASASLGVPEIGPLCFNQSTCTKGGHGVFNCTVGACEIGFPEMKPHSQHSQIGNFVCVRDLRV